MQAGRLILFAARGDFAPASSQQVLACAIAGLRRRRRRPMCPIGWAALMDAEGVAWQEIDLARLAQDPAFLRVGL